MDLSTVVLQGLQQADAQLQTAVASVATAAAPSPDGANLDTVSLSDAVVALMSAKDLFAVNASVMKTADELQQKTLDVMA